ncbi:MAG: type II toxin-antitoxin system VapC family toxin [Burkholderiales bacterium]
MDTSVWSLALRRSRKADGRFEHELGELIREGRVEMVGPIRQELLSGVKQIKEFQRLRDELRAFPDVELQSRDFEEAAAFFNRCRQQGVQGSNTDFLLCAVAVRRNVSIFTTDADFTHFTRVLPIHLHALGSPRAVRTPPDRGV